MYESVLWIILSRTGVYIDNNYKVISEKTVIIHVLDDNFRLAFHLVCYCKFFHLNSWTDVPCFSSSYSVLVDNINTDKNMNYVFVGNHCLFNSCSRTVLYNFKTEVQTSNEGIVSVGYCRTVFPTSRAMSSLFLKWNKHLQMNNWFYLYYFGGRNREMCLFWALQRHT